MACSCTSSDYQLAQLISLMASIFLLAQSDGCDPRKHREMLKGIAKKLEISATPPSSVSSHRSYFHLPAFSPIEPRACDRYHIYLLQRTETTTFYGDNGVAGYVISVSIDLRTADAQQFVTDYQRKIYEHIKEAIETQIERRYIGLASPSCFRLSSAVAILSPWLQRVPACS